MFSRISKYLLAAATLVAGTYLAIYFFMSPVPPDVSMADTDPREWMPGKGATVRVTGHDTLRAYDLRIVLRYDDRFTVDSLPLSVTVLTPDSMTFTENIVVATDLPPDRLKDVAEISAPYRNHNILRRKGTYTFTLSHTLPEPVAGISAVGIMLE